MATKRKPRQRRTNRRLLRRFQRHVHASGAASGRYVSIRKWRPSVFSPEYKVPDKLVAETPALRKKTNSNRGTAGLKRKVLVKEIVRQKSLRRPSRRAS